MRLRVSQLHPGVASQKFVEEIQRRRSDITERTVPSRGLTERSLSPFPSPARAGEGCRRGVTPWNLGLRPGLRYCAPNGAMARSRPGSATYSRNLRLGTSALLAGLD